MIDLIAERPHRGLDLTKVDHEARLGIHLTGDVDVEVKGQPIQVLTGVTVGHAGQTAGGLKADGVDKLELAQGATSFPRTRDQ